jgi:D-alanyl-lipoteichoic acid acyltransferase DltB (MBOAT superfamily)
MPQLQKPVDPNRLYAGLAFLLILWGLFKKAIVANYLSTGIVDKAFLDPGAYGTWDLLLATYGYAVQIYCDFSAYSDIAIGVAALLGYHFARNFNQPYRAQSLQDFWRRWHISLSTWLRDYLYIPLGGNRKGEARTYANLMITMLLGGLWHGAALKFVFWGFLHGGGLAVERALGVKSERRTMLGRIVATVLVFHFVCLCWIFFRAESFARAVEFISGFARFDGTTQLATPFLLVLLVWGIAMHFIPPDLLRRVEGFWSRRGLVWQCLAAGIVVVLIEAAGSEGVAPFIYFQF